MNIKKCIVVFLSFCIVLNMCPAFSFAAETQKSGNTNADFEKPEKWNYKPVANTHSSPLMALADAEDDSIEVTVEATLSSGTKTTVSNATVSLYVGKSLKRTAKTGSDGVANLYVGDLSLEEKYQATVSAKKTIAQGKGISGSNRDDLFDHFPKDSAGDYIRYSYELHSEKIDANGNWKGKKIPVSLEKNKVDIAFLIDATGSMSDEINRTKDNITTLSEALVNRGLNVRFSVIEYRDITEGEATILHTYHGSNWYSSSEGVIDALSDIEVSGGGDDDETVMDALGMAASSAMKWRSGASKFLFVLTDAEYKTDNNYGYDDMSDVIADLIRQKIAASVITLPSNQSAYFDLYKKTGGIYASINSSNFATEMQKLAESVAKNALGDLTLNLSEPRLLYNMSVCYLANDKKSQSTDYYNSMKNMLNEYAKDVAQTSDGHVLINKVLLYSTDNRMNFYDTGNTASMADIHIETREKDDGTWLNNVQIHSNAYAGGFYSDTEVSSNESIDMFTHLKDSDSFLSRNTFLRIQMSAIEGAGWNNSFKDDAAQYATTVTHESGHYLFEFYDEYMDQNKNNWSETNRPGGRYGLMDNQHDDIEMSKKDIDYWYFDGTIPSGSDSRHTYHSATYGMSCEEKLASLLTSGTTEISGTADLDIGNYQSQYTYVSGSSDRTADYSYAKLNDGDFLSLTSSSSSGTAGTVSASAESSSYAGSYFEDMDLSKAPFGEVSISQGQDGLTFTLKPDRTGTYSLYVLNQGSTSYMKVPFARSANEYVANLPIEYGEMGELYIVNSRLGKKTCTHYTVDRSDPTDTGFIFTTFNKSVIGYAANNAENSYTILGNGSTYTNGDYSSVNDAVIISEENAGKMTGGELYSVASKNALIDYSSVSWFFYKNGVWRILPSETFEEENNNIGVRTDIRQSGLYVLMAKKPADEEALPVEDLEYYQKYDSDSQVYLYFGDPNGDTKYYNIYYSENDFFDTSADNLVKKVYPADSDEILVDFYDRDRTVYLGVEAVLEDGRRSPLSMITILTEASDSDGDGLPDWYCDKYELWPEDGEDKDIAESDDDGDRLTNYQEYEGGSDPTNPNDPVHTTAVPVQTISLNTKNVTIPIGSTATIKATISPVNASNKEVTWSIDNESVAEVTKTGGMSCTISGLEAGNTVLRAVSGDGGYVASCNIQVSNGVKAKGITIKGISHKIAQGKRIRLKAFFNPESTSNKKLKWTSSNTRIAKVNQDGLVTIMKKTGGKTVAIKATATDGSGVSATWKIKVMKGAVKAVKISGKKKVKAGKALKLKAKAKASKGANKKLIWISSNTRYATVNGSGKVFTKPAGKGKKVKITAMATDGSGKKKSIIIKIK